MNSGADSVSVIDSATNAVIATVTVGDSPFGLAVDPTGARVIVANSSSDNVSVIDTGSNQVVASVALGHNPTALGRFIGPSSH